MGGIAPSKAALNTGMAFIGFAIFPGRHTYDSFTFHLGFKSTTYTTISTGRDNGMVGLSHSDNTVFN